MLCEFKTLNLIWVDPVSLMSGPPTPPKDGSPYFPITERSASLARVHIGVTTPLIAIALAMFVARIWLRVRPWRISWEDYCMTIGVVGPKLNNNNSILANW